MRIRTTQTGRKRNLWSLYNELGTICVHLTIVQDTLLPGCSYTDLVPYVSILQHSRTHLSGCSYTDVEPYVSILQQFRTHFSLDVRIQTWNLMCPSYNSPGHFSLDVPIQTWNLMCPSYNSPGHTSPWMFLYRLGTICALLTTFQDTLLNGCSYTELEPYVFILQKSRTFFSLDVLI
ncbi:hypothetical protein Btru_031162 [Bulinus truncatus]|nr:hypothetical protein Btru_031162 [Bulinus truncatus]